MSTQSTSTFDGLADWTARKDAGRKLLVPVRCLGFWSAVVLPLVLFPMMILGLAGESLPLFASLVVANIAGAVLGRDYNRD
ncbi:hypothetical protein [Halorientalis sp.]|jgi:sirohydrochlorin ferrochelatase|uniref:hypothetical protein n=1 Tax=Halorientalis sp. TaxID=1931229 RepID=UPI00261596F3|nr:hypothetical protein [Halorientalis sp.]